MQRLHGYIFNPLYFSLLYLKKPNFSSPRLKWNEELPASGGEGPAMQNRGWEIHLKDVNPADVNMDHGQTNHYVFLAVRLLNCFGNIGTELTKGHIKLQMTTKYQRYLGLRYM